MIHQATIAIATRGRALYDVTRQVADVLRPSGIVTGLCHVFVRHTSASLVIQENADPAVLRDLDRWMAELAPEGARYEHADEGPDDMPAHLRAAITKTSETLPIRDGRLALGTWQALYLYEHRSAPHRRELIVTAMGDGP